MLAIRLKPELEARLAKLAERTGRTKTFYAREAITEHIGDLEDYYLAVDAIKDTGKIYSSKEIKGELGL